MDYLGFGLTESQRQQMAAKLDAAMKAAGYDLYQGAYYDPWTGAKAPESAYNDLMAGKPGPAQIHAGEPLPGQQADGGKAPVPGTDAGRATGLLPSPDGSGSPAPAKPTDWTLVAVYVGIGIVLVAVGIGLYFKFRKKS